MPTYIITKGLKRGVQIGIIHKIHKETYRQFSCEIQGYGQGETDVKRNIIWIRISRKQVLGK
jgi:hypothetical protein